MKIILQKKCTLNCNKPYPVNFYHQKKDDSVVVVPNRRDGQQFIDNVSRYLKGPLRYANWHDAYSAATICCWYLSNMYFWFCQEFDNNKHTDWTKTGDDEDGNYDVYEAEYIKVYCLQDFAGFDAPRITHISISK